MATPTTDFRDAIDGLVDALETKTTWAAGGGLLFGSRVYRDADLDPGTEFPAAMVRTGGERRVSEVVAGSNPKMTLEVPALVEVAWEDGYDDDAPTYQVHAAMLAAVQTAVGKWRATQPAAIVDVAYVGGGTDLGIVTPDATTSARQVFGFTAEFAVTYQTRLDSGIGE